MVSKNSMTVLGAFVAVQGVAAQVWGVDESRNASVIPLPLERRLQFCDSGDKFSAESTLPCDLEKYEDGRLLQQAGLNLTDKNDLANATKMVAYRDAVKQLTFRRQAQDCCLSCKLLHKVHNREQDQFWRQFYAPAKIDLWYAQVDKWAANETQGPVAPLWEFLQSLNNATFPHSGLDFQMLNVTEHKPASYCPELGKPESTTSDASVTYPGPCVPFAAAEPSSVKRNVTDVKQFVACPINCLNGSQGQTVVNTAKVVSEFQVEAKIALGAFTTAQCACKNSGSDMVSGTFINIKLVSQVSLELVFQHALQSSGKTAVNVNLAGPAASETGLPPVSEKLPQETSEQETSEPEPSEQKPSEPEAVETAEDGEVCY